MRPDAPRPVPLAAESSGAPRLKAFYELTKPGITGYVMTTAGVSAFVASRGSLDLTLAVHTIAGTGLSTAGALALNQYVERDVDAIMVRTRDRPLPSGRVTPRQGLAFSVALLTGGLAYLGLAVGWLPASIAAASALMYLGVYTPLKTRSYGATLAGGIPGALPTLIGWTAATGSFEIGGLALFGIAYMWQLPHVLGLAWMLRDDYERVGFKLIPSGGGHVIGMHMVAATALLLPASLAPSVLGYTGAWYSGGALLASTAFLGVAAVAARGMSDLAARRVFLGSLLYHPLLLGFMLFDTVRL